MKNNRSYQCSPIRYKGIKISRIVRKESDCALNRDSFSERVCGIITLEKIVCDKSFTRVQNTVALLTIQLIS